MKEVFGAAPDEGFVGWLLPEGFEELTWLSGDGRGYREDSGIPCMQPDIDREECREKCFVDIRSRIVLAMLLLFGTSSVIQKQVRITIA